MILIQRSSIELENGTEIQSHLFQWADEMRHSRANSESYCYNTNHSKT